jgi:hypothetical protein
MFPFVVIGGSGRAVFSLFSFESSKTQHGKTEFTVPKATAYSAEPGRFGNRNPIHESGDFFYAASEFEACAAADVEINFV